VTPAPAPNHERPLRFGMLIGPRPPGLLENLPEWAATAERGGIDLIGTGEAPHLFHDPYILLSLVATHSERVLVGPVMTTPLYRHPATLASTMATIQELSGGRAFLGIGIGDAGFLSGIGERPVTLEQMIDYSLAVRALAAGEAARWKGKQIQLDWNAGRVPVLFGAEGRRALQAAGEFADGAIIGNGANPEIVRFAWENIRAGAARAGRSLDELEVWFMIRIRVSESEEQGADELAFYAARWIPHALRSRASARARGFVLDDDLQTRVAGYLAEYSHEQAYVPGSRHNVDLLERFELKEWATRQFLLTGTIEQITARLEELIEAGARNILAVQMLPDYMAHTEAAAKVFATLRAEHQTSGQPV
jgi:5,10-methylenetetrahydromethanopterin reductase